MKTITGSIIFLVTACCLSCSVKRYLKPGEKLYDGATVEIEKDTSFKSGESSYKKQLKGLALPKKNKMLFGMPYKAWWWYKIGPTKKEKGFTYWLRNKFGQAPVLNSSLKPEANAANMQAYLQNKGHFNTTVTADTTSGSYKMKANYRVKLTQPFMISSVVWRLDSSGLSNDILAATKAGSVLKANTQFDVSNIKAEWQRIALMLQDKGYYFFKTDYFLSYIDTNKARYAADIHLALEPDIPRRAGNRQFISRVTATLSTAPVEELRDTSHKSYEIKDSILLIATTNEYKPSIFTKAITYQPGDQYSLKQHNSTLNRFITMGTFKFAKGVFQQPPGSTMRDSLEAYYYVTRGQKKNIQVELDGFTRSNALTGAEISLNWRNRNLLRGAETLIIKPSAGFELSLSDSLKENNNWRVGIETSLEFPKILTPFKIREHLTYIPKTILLFSYDWYRRQDSYTKNYLHFHYGFRWQDTITRYHVFVPFSVTYNTTSNYTKEYLLYRLQEEGLKYVSPPELIMSSFYFYQVTHQKPNSRNSYFFGINAEIGGTILRIIRGKDEPYTEKILNAYYAQFVKTGVDGRYTRKLSKTISLANRLVIGLSYPYGNSAFLPFSKQFTVGGANSMRGFVPRRLGPGSTRATSVQQGLFPVVGGDYKLEANTELRFPLAGVIKGAFFIDAGNVWMKDTLLYGVGGKLTKQFISEIAVDAGIGFRVDISILVIRLDLAIPFRKPWLDPGHRWVFNELAFGDPDWRDENLVWNIGIGLPF